MKFKEYLPDLDEFENPGLVTCRNVIPGSTYQPMRHLVAQGAAMAETCLGAYSTKDDGGNSFNCAGTAQFLYKLNGNNWTQTNSGFSTGAESFWRFERFGDLIIGTNFDNPVQKYDLSSDTVFAPLAGSPPQAKHVAVVRDFLVLGNLNGAANKVQWSGNNDATEWTPGEKESDGQVIPEGGPVTGLMGGEYGLVFQESRITRMDYQGPPYNFSFDEIEKNVGCIASGSIIRFGVFTYYLSQNGFYVTDGTQSFPIGDEKIDKTFFKNFDEEKAYKMGAIIDPINKLVIWSVVGKDSPNGLPNWLYIYNWNTKRWADVEVGHQALFNSLTTGTTMEALDAEYPNLDLMNTSLDSRIFQGGASILSAIDLDNKLATFTGDVMEAVLKTGTFEINEMQVTLVSQVWPQMDGNVQVKVGSKMSHAVPMSYTGDITVNTIGFAPFMENGRFHNFEFTINDFTRASGFKLKQVSTGEY